MRTNTVQYYPQNLSTHFFFQYLKFTERFENLVCNLVARIDHFLCMVQIKDTFLIYYMKNCCFLLKLGLVDSTGKVLLEIT